MGFLSFSLISSCVYIINDARDIEMDRLHPRKRDRPMASGAVSVKAGASIAALCFLLSTGAILLLMSCHEIKFTALAWLLAYLILNLLYSFGLKNVPVLDILILASGFLIRILFGAVLADTSVSSWLYLTVMSGAFYFALGKRRNEMMRSEGTGSTRKVLEAYGRSFLDKFMYVSLAMANVFYALWAKEYPRKHMVLTVPLVVAICMQYGLDVEGDSDGDPVEVVLGDGKLVLLCIALLAAMAFIILGGAS